MYAGLHQASAQDPSCQWTTITGALQCWCGQDRDIHCTGHHNAEDEGRGHPQHLRVDHRHEKKKSVNGTNWGQSCSLTYQSLIKQINTVADLITSFLLLILLPVLFPLLFCLFQPFLFTLHLFLLLTLYFFFSSILSPSLSLLPPSLYLQAQYVYIHDALQEYIVCGDTSIPAEKIRNAMVSLQKVSDHKSGYQKQFEVKPHLHVHVSHCVWVWCSINVQ